MWVGLALAAPAVSYALCAPLWGKASARWSRKWMVVRSLIGIAISMFGMAMASTPFLFFLFRLLQGALGGIYDASTTWIASSVPEQERRGALSAYQTAVAAGSMIGPLAGGMFMDRYGGQWLLVSFGGLLLLCGAAVSLLLKETVKEEAPKEEASKEEAPKRGSSVPRGGVWGAYRQILTQGNTRLYLLSGIAVKCAVFGLLAVYGMYVMERYALGRNTAAWLGGLEATVSLGALLGAAWWGRRRGRARLRTDFAVAAGAGGLAIVLQALPVPPTVLLPLRLLQGFFFSALVPMLMLAVVEACEPREQGVQIGAVNSLLVVGQAGGPLAAAWLLGITNLSFVIVLLGLLPIAAAAWILGDGIRSHWKGRGKQSVWLPHGKSQNKKLRREY